MDIKLSINSPYECVFLVNGKFIEQGQIAYGNDQVVYITVMPLDAMLLPYTVKLVGGCVRCNNSLCKCYKLADDKYYLKLAPRFNYVYTPAPAQKEQPKGIIEKFFGLVLDKKTGMAREYMTKELSQSIDDDALTDFFNGFKDIVADDNQGGLYYLIKDDGSGVLYNFVIDNNLIENIIES